MKLWSHFYKKIISNNALIRCGLCLLLATPSFSQSKYVIIFLDQRVEGIELSQTEKDSLQIAHRRNILDLAHENKLLVAGPFELGGGIFIMNTTSVTDAREWANTDPAVGAGLYNLEILPWTPRVNQVCQVDKEAKVTTCTFVRYSSNITKYNVREEPIWLLHHDRFIKNLIETGNVISEGFFANSDGYTLILKGSVQPAVIMADPSVQSGFLIPDIRTIWLAEGSFCE